MKSAYYDSVWCRKLSLPAYATLEARWRSRWDFALGEVPGGSHVLDAGCGDGVLGELLRTRRGCHVLGLDISHLAAARARARGLAVAVADISSQSFPFADASFDVVAFLCCLEHIFDPGHALAEAARVLRPQGRILVTLPNAVQYRIRLDLLRGRLSQRLLHTRQGEGLHIRFFDYRGDLESLLRQEVPQLEVVRKVPALKNPRAGPAWRRLLLGTALTLWPNLFAEYVHYRIMPRPASPRPPEGAPGSDRLLFPSVLSQK